MDDTAIRNELTEIFQDLFGDGSISLQPTTTAADLPGWDSLKHISLIVAIEDNFGIKINTNEMDALRNVGDLEAVISRKTSGTR